MQEQSKAALSSIRTEMVHEFVTVYKVEVPDDFFFGLAQAEMDSGRYAEAAICIASSKIFDRFECHALCMNLIDINRTKECKLILDSQPELRRPVIESLSPQPKHAKTATKLVIDYDLPPESFPQLMTIVARNSSIFFISRVFKRIDHPDYAPLYKIEDLLSGQPQMLAFLVE